LLLEVFTFLLATLVLLLIAGVAYQQHGLHRDRSKYLPPGRLIALGPRHLHVYETGCGSPAVVFESGLASSSLTWTFVQQQIAAVTRAVSYDRGGIGWSEETSDPRTVRSMVDDLKRMLSASGNPPPYILVGHSFGGLLVQAYASLKGADVAALVLVDPVSLDFWADCGARDERRLRLGVKLSRRGILLANVGVVRLALAALESGKTRLTKAVAKATAGKAMGTMGRLTGVVLKLPPSVRQAVQSHWSQAKSFRALAEYLDVLRQCAEEARTMEISPDLPLTILSAANATAQELAERQAWADASIHGSHRQIADSGHWIQLEHPEEVVDAVLEMIEYLGQSRRLHPAE
jgi:pimeloyl-ACP methyl ester carboxylesterase